MNTPNRQLHTWIRSNPSPLTGEVGPKGRVRVIIPLILAFLAILLPAPTATAATNLAVFNFQLKTGQEDWVWLEKFMSDQMATDLVQDRSLSVVARDQMQLIADKMKWAPEFATGNEEVMGGIGSQLGIEYLVTGVCSIKDDQLEITAQIVEVKTRKEVHRKTVTGKTGQVIDLQKQLSADVMAWFTKKPAGEILKTLPMWTRSIPAVRALYEGMHLYDQGRYAEGWVKFRESSREDVNYVEAIYWVGKMYYFMYRYEHARRTLERFVYLDCLHPRMGDAIAEYAHTFESSDATPEELLALYDAVQNRFPDIIIYGRYPQLGENWASAKRAGLLSRMRSDRELAVMSAPVVANEGWAENKTALLGMLRHHALTGEVLPDNVITETKWPRVKRSIQHFAPGAPANTYRFTEAQRIYGRASADRDKEAIFRREDCDFMLHLLAPSGFVFTSLRFDPLAQGSDAVVTVSLREPGSLHDIDPAKVPLPRARAGGIVFRPAPRLGMLIAKCSFNSQDAKARCVAVEGITVSATLEKLTEHGAVEVQCSNTDDFRVDVDGVFGRWSSGLVGLLPPGPHRLTIRPIDAHSPLGTWTTTVDIQAGKIAKVTGSLPWRKQAFSDSIVTTRVLPASQQVGPFMFAPQQGPAVVLDDSAIRMIWSRGDDLWSSSTADGSTFSKPQVLPLPVSTAWEESDPRLFRDESGRFVLTFLSNRDAQHRRLAYFCWSRDFVHWSNPCLISDTSCRNYDVIQSPDGRYICAIAYAPDDWTTVTLLSSRDGYQWEAQPGKPISFNQAPIRIRGRSDGAIELYAVPTLPGTQSPSGQHEMYKLRTQPAYEQLVRFVHDGGEWSPKEILMGFPYDESPDWISLTQDNRGPVILASKGYWDWYQGTVQLLRETNGQWQSTGPVSGFALYSGELAYNPRWGYVMSHGGYLTQSRMLPALIADAAAETPKPTIIEPNIIANARTTQSDADDRVENVCIPFAPPPRAHAPLGPKLPPPKPGELRYKMPGNYAFDEAIRIEDEERFAKPAKGCGTIHPNAVVVTMEHNGLPVALALDSDDPNSVNYELVRLDFSGKGDFRDAVVAHRDVMWFYPPVNEYRTYFEAKPAYVTVDGQVIPIEIGVSYVETDHRVLKVFLRASAEGMCVFGDKQYKVEILDDNNNLHLGDVAWPGSKKGYDTVVVSPDRSEALIVRYGEPVTIDGKLYDVRISADGNSVTAMNYAGPAGYLKVGRPAWSAWLLGKSSRFSIAGGMDPVPVPPGEYKLAYYNEFSSSDGTKPRYRLSIDGTVTVHVKSGENVSVDIGSPLTGKLTADVSGRIVKFQYTERDASGSMAKIELPGKKVFSYARSVKIVDSNNRAIFGLSLDTKNGQDGWDAKWQVREGLSGTFTATMESDTGPFIPKPATATFTVK